MGNSRSCRRQLVDLWWCEPDHVDEDRAWSKQSHTLSIVNWREAKFLVEVGFIRFDFGQVHRNAHIALTGQIGHLAIEFRGDAARCTWSEPDMDALICCTLPLTMHIQHTKQTGFAALNHTWMHRIALRCIGADIHHDTSQAGANTAFLNGSSNPIETIAVCQHRFEEG